MKRASIKFRVTAWFTAVMLVVSVAMFFIMVENRIRQVTDEAEQLLIKNVADFAMSMQKMPERPTHRTREQAPPPEPRESINIERAMYGKGVHYVVYNDDGEVIAGHIPFDFEDTVFEDGKVRTVTESGEKYLVLDKKEVIHDGSVIWVKGVTNLSGALNAVDVTKGSDFLIIAVLILVAAFGGYLIVKRALLPVEKISMTAQKISQSNNLSKRIALGEGNDEIYHLAGVIDNMLERIEGSFESEKQFTSDASHELRTPVAVIVSECEYALECAKTAGEYEESITVIKRQAEKMSKLISGLLMISRMDKNTMEINFKKINVSEILSAICEEQKEINNTPLIANIQDDVYAMADEMLIARLFINLINNAFEYGAEGEYVKVLLESDGDRMIFSVEDKGIGIPDEEQSKIWERFYRVNKSRNSENGNMGLGLSMVKEIAERHNGKMELESKPGEGSVFRFVMPIDN